MVSPRFSETVQVVNGGMRQAAPSSSTPLTVLGGGRTDSLFSAAATPADLIKHYSYWNFVAIRRICDRVSTLNPNVGYKTALPTPVTRLQSISGKNPDLRPARLTQSQRAHLTKCYGGVVQSHQDLEPVPESHPLPLLLSHVNPRDTWQTLVDDTFLYLQLTGEFYWWLIPSRVTMASGHKLPAEIWLIPSNFVTNWNYDREGNLVSYTIIPNGISAKRQEIPVEEILWYGNSNPHCRQRGFSAIQAAPHWTLNVERVEASRGAGFINGINPDLIVTLDKEVDPYTKDGKAVADIIKEKLIQRQSGFMRNREPVVIPPGVSKIEKWSNTPREMDFSSSADQVRDQGLALHGVPKVIAGITTDVNRATVEGANVVFCENVLNPNLSKFAGFLTEKLASRFDPRIVIWYDDCTPRNAEHDLRETQLDWQMGAITPDERRVDRGRQPIGETAYESGYIGSAVVPLSDSVKDENMERALDIAGARAEPNADDGEDDPESDDGGEKKPPKKPAKKSDPPEDDSEDEEEQAVAAGSNFPSLDLLAQGD